MVAPIFLRETIGRGIVRALSSQFSGLSQAILELTDNPLDYREGASIRIDLWFDRAKRTITIVSLGGRGMDTSDFARFLSWGDSGHHVAGDIGAYGQGAKAALAYLGDGVRIWSRRKGSNQTWLLEDSGWRTRTELRDFGLLEPVTGALIPVEFRNVPKDEGCVLIQVFDCDMNRRWNLNVLRRQLGSTYRALIRNETLSITINGQLVSPTTIELDTSAPSVLLGFKKGEVTASGWAGRLDRRRSDEGVRSGLRLYANGRLIAEGMWFGFNWTGKGSFNHLIGEVDIHGLTPNLNKSAFVEADDEIWSELGKTVLDQMHPLLVALRSTSDARQVSRHERALLKTVRKELAATLREIVKEGASAVDGDTSFGRGRKRARRGRGANTPTQISTPTGRKNEPRTPAPDEAVGNLQRTASRIKGVPNVRLETWDQTVRSVIASENGNRVLLINAAYPLYGLSDGSKAYLAETILLELLQADPDVPTKQDLVSQLDVLLRRWSQRQVENPIEFQPD
jgi:hypothetical protein